MNHPCRVRLVVLWAVWAVAGAAWAARPELEILSPAQGFRANGGAVWLVVKASVAPQVKLDGRPVFGTRPPARRVYHVRLEGLRPEGSKVDLRVGRIAVGLVLYGSKDGVKDHRFHLAPPRACDDCHPAGAGNCGGCHRRMGGAHGFSPSEGCPKCHQAGGAVSAPVPALCFPCHPGYAKGGHAKLRHPVSSPKDPRHPERPFDCSSCHEPHAPEPLGRQSPEERKAWCKSCHRR